MPLEEGVDGEVEVAEAMDLDWPSAFLAPLGGMRKASCSRMLARPSWCLCLLYVVGKVSKTKYPSNPSLQPPPCIGKGEDS